MSHCGRKMQEYVARGYGYKEITVRCGSTSPTGYPWECEKCRKLNAGRDYRREAIMNGENFDDDY